MGLGEDRETVNRERGAKSGESLRERPWVQGRADQGLPSRAQALTGGTRGGLVGWRAVTGQILADISTRKCYPAVLTELPLLVCFFLITLTV